MSQNLQLKHEGKTFGFFFLLFRSIRTPKQNIRVLHLSVLLSGYTFIQVIPGKNKKKNHKQVNKAFKILYWEHLNHPKQVLP